MEDLVRKLLIELGEDPETRGSGSNAASRGDIHALSHAGVPSEH